MKSLSLEFQKRLCISQISDVWEVCVCVSALAGNNCLQEEIPNWDASFYWHKRRAIIIDYIWLTENVKKKSESLTDWATDNLKSRDSAS